MRYLFVHQNFPGQFLHLVDRLRRDPANDVVFICEPNENAIPGVRKLTYARPMVQATTFHDALDFELAMMRARIVEALARQLRGLGFMPDIIIGHHGWGELLNLQDVWPGVPLLGYFEFYYQTHGLDVGFDPEFGEPDGGYGKIRAKNAVNLLALTNPGHGQTPTRFQHGTYPDWAQRDITVLPEGVNLELCAPNPAVRRAAIDLEGFRIEPGDTLVTYVARDLEPYRGFHTFMRALPRVLRVRADVKVVAVGGDNVSYGARLSDGRTWRQQMLDELGPALDRSRVCFPGRVTYETFLRLLKRSDAHVYLTYPFVLSWSLRESLAAGCALVAADVAPVREFVEHRRTGLLAPFPDQRGLADAILEILEDRALNARLRRNARKFAERTLGMEGYLRAYEGLIGRLTGG